MFDAAGGHDPSVGRRDKPHYVRAVSAVEPPGAQHSSDHGVRARYEEMWGGDVAAMARWGTTVGHELPRLAGRGATDQSRHGLDATGDEPQRLCWPYFKATDRGQESPTPTTNRKKEACVLMEDSANTLHLALEPGRDALRSAVD